MAEDSAGHDNEELIAGIEHGDLKPHFYEGGFKTWECALDLAKLVANDNTIIESLDNSQTDVHIIEVGHVLISPFTFENSLLTNPSLARALQCRR